METCAVTHHSDGSERKQVIVLLAVAPGIPTRILALLQNVHLSAEVHLLKAHKTAGDKKLGNLFINNIEYK